MIHTKKAASGAGNTESGKDIFSIASIAILRPNVKREGDSAC